MGESPSDSFRIYGIPKQSDPREINRFFSLLDEGVWDGQELKLRLELGYVPVRSAVALLRSAYLLMFRLFGYRYVCDRSAVVIRESISQPTIETDGLKGISWRVDHSPPSDLAGKGKATSTIRTAASAVSAAHRAAGFSGGNPSAHEDVKDFLRGVEREAPPQRQVAAMMPDVISAIRATARTPRRGRGGRMENSETAEARARVDVALALTLRDGGLRVSEAAALTWKDVERWADGSGRLTILRSKTDQEGKGAVVAVTPRGRGSTDPDAPAHVRFVHTDVMRLNRTWQSQ